MSSVSPEPIAAPGGRFFSRKLRRSLRHASFLLGLALLAAIVAAAILAPLLASHDPYEQDLANRLIPPFWMDGSEPAHLLGTDQLGRDLLARLLFGARVSLAIGFAAMLMSAVIGISLGLLAGFFLWPNWEGPHLPKQLAAAVRVDRFHRHALAAQVHMRLEILDACILFQDREVLRRRDLIRQDIQSTVEAGDGAE